jgi:sugar phosphate isomerase/epimerase
MDFSVTVEPPMPPLSIADTSCLADVSRAGFTHADWCWDWCGKPVFYEAAFMTLAARAFEHHNLRLSSVHGYACPPAGLTFTRELFLAVNVNRIEFASRMGAKVLVAHVPLHDVPSQEEALAESIDVLEDLRPAAEKAGVRVAVEDLYSPRQFDQIAFFDALFARFGPEYLGLCYDSGHASMTGCQDFVERYASRLLCTHLHDNDGKNDLHHLPGTGVADWTMILGSLKRSGFAGPVNMEIRIPRDEPHGPFFKQALKALQDLWAKA